MQVQRIDTGIDIGPTPSKISRISLIFPLSGCKNMYPLDPISTWSCPAWGYLSMIAGSPFYGGGCTNLDSSNWRQTVLY